MYLEKLSSSVPDLGFYTHFIFDKRLKPDIYEEFPENTLDEDAMLNYLKNYKITSLENSFKETKISTFDVGGDIYYNSKLYSESKVKQIVSDALREKYKLENRTYNQDIKKSILTTIVQGLSGVQWVNIKFLGKDLTDSLTGVENEINCKFNEILVLAEDRYSGGVQAHGVKFDFYRAE